MKKNNLYELFLGDRSTSTGTSISTSYRKLSAIDNVIIDGNIAKNTITIPQNIDDEFIVRVFLETGTGVNHTAFAVGANIGCFFVWDNPTYAKTWEMKPFVAQSPGGVLVERDSVTGVVSIWCDTVSPPTCEEVAEQVRIQADIIGYIISDPDDNYSNNLALKDNPWNAGMLSGGTQFIGFIPDGSDWVNSDPSQGIRGGIWYHSMIGPSGLPEPVANYGIVFDGGALGNLKIKVNNEFWKVGHTTEQTFENIFNDLSRENMGSIFESIIKFDNYPARYSSISSQNYISSFDGIKPRSNWDYEQNGYGRERKFNYGGAEITFEWHMPILHQYTMKYKDGSIGPSPTADYTPIKFDVFIAG